MPISEQILVLFSHPAAQKSKVNRALIEQIDGLEGVRLHDLYEEYPDFDIDVGREQDLLTNHDLIVFQFPLYWYSVPALLKEWMDLVLEHGWAYGSSGGALEGKKLLIATSTGGGEPAYQPEGYNRFTMSQLLTPLEQTARLCRMDFLPPFVVHGTHQLQRPDVERHARDYGRVLAALARGEIDLQAARSFPRMNSDIDSLMRAN